MGNRIGAFQIELFLEGQDTPTVLGTDGISHVDGRWTMNRAHDYIANFAHDYCERYNAHATRKAQWRGTVYLLDGRYRSVKV